MLVSGRLVNQFLALFFKKIIDFLYLQQHSSYFKAQNIKPESYLTNPNLLALARARWESRFLESEFIRLSPELIENQPKGFRAVFDVSKKTLYWASILGVNYLSIQAFYFPMIYPRFSFFNFSKIRYETASFLKYGFENGFQRFTDRFGHVIRYERYNNWVRKVFPYLLVATMLVNSGIEYYKAQDLAKTTTEQTTTETTKIENLETRKSIETAVLEIMSQAYKTEFGVVLDPSVIKEFNSQIFNNQILDMSLKELG